jgi:hypothetical protein
MLNSHTHCQVAQADPQTKTWQRVCLPQRTDKEKNNEGTTSATRAAAVVFGGHLSARAAFRLDRN